MFFSERDQEHDTKKEQGLSIIFSQSDSFISQNEHFWLSQHDNATTNSESSETTLKLNVYSRRCNFNCSVTAKVQKGIMITLRQNVHTGICNGVAMEKAIWEGQSTGV